MCIRDRVEPFRLAGTDLRIFNTLITPSEENKVSEILDGSSKEITILIRPAQAAACVWLDGAKIFDGGITWNSRIDFSLMQYSFINTGSNIQAASSWELDSLGVFELREFQLTSTPPDGATFVNASQTNRILLHTGTPFLPSNDLEGIITLKDDSENILPCVVSGGGETIILSPNSPLSGSKTYAVTVTGLTDMDGGVLTKSISFSTAPEGYTPPSVKITSPAQGTQFFAGQCVEAVSYTHLAELFGLTEASASGFSDVSFTDWFAPYVIRCAAENIVQGSGGYFYPDQSITREDAALMLYRALKNRNIPVSYTHLDVYKRQIQKDILVLGRKTYYGQR